MWLARTLNGWVSGKHNSIADCEAEIREELEFHLEMRSLDNQAAGMSAEEARCDAQSRFGDFEKQYQACRQVTLAWPLALRRLQMLLFVGLLAAVALMGWALIKAQHTQSNYETELADLRKQLEVSQTLVLSPQSEANLIPDVEWNPNLMIQSLAESYDSNVSEIYSDFATNVLDQPWSDWSSLAESPLSVVERP